MKISGSWERSEARLRSSDLFGTVVGILTAFQNMAKTGSGGFAVVASGISESLIATAAGIVVAVISVMAYNAFQTRWNQLVSRFGCKPKNSLKCS